MALFDSGVPLANVALSDTFNTWRVRTNQINTQAAGLASNNTFTGTLNTFNNTASFKGPVTAPIATANTVSVGSTLSLDSVNLTAIQTSGEGFSDNDTSIMTSAAVNDRIESFGYSTTTGTVTSVGITAGNLIDVSGSPVTTSGNITVDVDLSELTTSTSDADGDFFVVVDSVNAQKKLTKGNINISGFNNDSGYSTTTGTVTSVQVTAGTGLSGGGTVTASGNITVDVDLSELTDMTDAMVGTDEFIVLDAGADRRKAANEIPLSIFNNDAGFTTNTGDIEGVTAGNGLTDGGTSGTVTLNVGAGTGVTVNANDIAIGQAVATSSDVQFDSFGVGTAPSGTTGEIRATNNITAYYSDERLKDFKGTIADALQKVNSLNGYMYTGNETAKDLGYDNEDLQVGVSAQEVEKVLPEVVTMAPVDIGQDEDGNEYSLSGNNYKTVYYEKLVPLLIEAIKELSAKVETLENNRNEG